VAGCGRYAIGGIRRVKGYRGYDFPQTGSECYLDRRRFFFGLIFNVVTVENLLFPRSMRRKRQAQVSKNAARANQYGAIYFRRVPRDAASCKRSHRDVHQHRADNLGDDYRKIPDSLLCVPKGLSPWSSRSRTRFSISSLPSILPSPISFSFEVRQRFSVIFRTQRRIIFL